MSNLSDSGIGSLRWAIGEANRTAGFDTIRFDSSLTGGTISLGSALEDLTDKVALSGFTENGNKPQLAIDFNGHAGLRFSGKKAKGSSLVGLALLDAGGDGLTLDSSRITVQNCYIGVALDGITAAGNAGHGIRITEQSQRNLIGSLDPLTGMATSDQFFNVISSNGGNGIQVDGSDRNRIANNRIGTSADGNVDRGNGLNGIELTNRANNNVIGGDAANGNDPTKDTFARPGQGNLISGNSGNGVSITGSSRHNRLMGNFIGTNAAGTAAIGNSGDGVSLINADHNSLIGTTRNQSPFIYYNVVSGNQGNGLRVQNSDHITIHANFFGLGADNETPVANGGDGALIEGDSRNIQYGGVIPLGNVNAGNLGNGINVTDQVRNFITFNTFAGLTAFGGTAPNQLSGIRISSSGGKNRVRTNVMAGNLLDGLTITDAARDIWVDPNIIGLNTYGTEATQTINNQLVSFSNGRDGIRIEGTASKIRIAGRRPSVIPQNTISNNNNYGINILDRADDILIDQTFIGLSSSGGKAFGNVLGGIHVETTGTNLRIGRRANTSHGNQINSNGGDGIQLVNTNRAKLFNNTSNSNQRWGFAIRTATNTIQSGNTGTDNGAGLYN